MMGSIGGFGGGGNVSWENFVHFDPHDKDSVTGSYDFFDASLQYNAEKKLPADRSRMNSPARGSDGKALNKEEYEKSFLNARNPEIFRYQNKIKKIIDPNNIGDSHYFTLSI